MTGSWGRSRGLNVSLKLRFHQPPSGLNPSGLLLLEAAPQTRSISVYSQTREMKRFHFPYLYFTVRYLKYGKEYKAAMKKYDEEMAQYNKDLEAYKDFCKQEKIKKMEEELSKLKGN